MYLIHIHVQVGSASSQDVVLLRGQLEAARSEAESAALQWAAEREALVAAAADLYGEMQRTHAALEAAVAQVSAATVVCSNGAVAMVLQRCCCCRPVWGDAAHTCSTGSGSSLAVVHAGAAVDQDGAASTLIAP
jgi:hypothetical protein